jgi:hypothetical protein
MFKKHNFSIDVEDKDEMKIFKNIRRFGIFRVAACVVVFPCIDVIAWILSTQIWGVDISATLKMNP